MNSDPLVKPPTNLIRDYWMGKAKENKTKENKTKTPTELFKKYCENEPWQVECKEYDV